MKRGLLSLIPVALGAVAWSVNWKLDHPPQTNTDKTFARLVQGTEEVEISACLERRRVRLKGDELHNFVESIHLTNQTAPSYSSCDARYTLNFKRKGRETVTFSLDFNENGLQRTSTGATPFHPVLEKRTGSRLARLVFDLMSRARKAS